MATGLCAVLGLAALILRVAFPAWTKIFAGVPLVWLVPLPLLLIALAFWLGLRRLPPAATVRAAIDGYSTLGGLLMSAAEGDIGAWRSQLSPAATPAVRWRMGRPMMMTLASGAFLAAVLLVPEKYLPETPQTLQVAEEIQKLTEKIELLKQEEIVSPEKAQVLEKSLDQLQKEATGDDPVKTMEAMDHLEQSVAQAAAEATQEAINQSQQAQAAESLADALQKAQGQMNDEALTSAMTELAKMGAKAAAEDAALAQSMNEELLNACQNNSLDEGQLGELAGAMKLAKDAKLGKLRKLAKGRLIDPKALESCQESEDEGELADFLAQCENGEEVCDALATCNLPGQGGVNRGRGDAAMTWTEGSNKEGASFKEQALTPSSVLPDESHLVGISAADPTSAKPVGGSTGGALNAAAGAGSANTQVILPEHKNAVNRYFNREKKPRTGQAQSPTRP